MTGLPVKEHVALQYGAEGRVVTELRDAHYATLFTPDSEVIIHMVKTRPGNWRAETSDHWLLTRREERARFRTPQELMFALAEARHVRLSEITLV